MKISGILYISLLVMGVMVSIVEGTPFIEGPTINPCWKFRYNIAEYVDKTNVKRARSFKACRKACRKAGRKDRSGCNQMEFYPDTRECWIGNNEFFSISDVPARSVFVELECLKKEHGSGSTTTMGSDPLKACERRGYELVPGYKPYLNEAGLPVMMRAEDVSGCVEACREMAGCGAVGFWGRCEFLQVGGYTLHQVNRYAAELECF